MKSELINISKIELNSGQIEGLPKNPRFIKDEQFKNLVQSIRELPEMLELRECIVFPFEKKYVVIGGNMRLRACKEFGIKEIPCKILDIKTPVKMLCEIAIKDNGIYGNTDFDLIANEWSDIILPSWGLGFPESETHKKEKIELKDFSRCHILLSYHPDKQIELNEIINEDNYMINDENEDSVEEIIEIESNIPKNEEVVLKRSFGGKIKDFSSKEEEEFEKRHLKAYLKGHTNFNHGFSGSWPNNLPNTHTVKEIWT